MCEVFDIIKQQYGVDEEDLQHMPYKLYKWVCGHPECHKHKRVKDYGFGPLMRTGKMFTISKKPRIYHYWSNTDTHYFVCNPHSKIDFSPVRKELILIKEVTPSHLLND